MVEAILIDYIDMVISIVSVKITDSTIVRMNFDWVWKIRKGLHSKVFANDGVTLIVVKRSHDNVIKHFNLYLAFINHVAVDHVKVKGIFHIYLVRSDFFLNKLYRVNRLPVVLTKKILLITTMAHLIVNFNDFIHNHHYRPPQVILKLRLEVLRELSITNHNSMSQEEKFIPRLFNQSP